MIVRYVCAGLQRWWIRNRWRAKASFVPIGQLQGLLSNVMIDSKHDELESISSTDLDFMFI